MSSELKTHLSDKQKTDKRFTEFTKKNIKKHFEQEIFEKREIIWRNFEEEKLKNENLDTRNWIFFDIF